MGACGGIRQGSTGSPMGACGGIRQGSTGAAPGRLAAKHGRTLPGGE
ncbi:MAG TPA: hypothetical protein VKY73_09195 [Polyangiaceae bacterium]|nr:hypothetical protein [Polyangiaceae bacterium]